MAGLKRPANPWTLAPTTIKALAAERQCTRCDSPRAKSAALTAGSTVCANCEHMAQPIRLAAHDLSCQRGQKILFQRLSFALGPGEGLRVSGPNGSGKTSLLRLIAGLLPMQKGRLEVGIEAPPLPELCHYVGHANGIKSALSVSANTSFWADFLEGEPARVRGALELFGLEALADLPAGLLSAGQKRKLALTRLFVAPRPIWLLDEPSVSLDAASVKLLDAAIVKHLKSGGLAVVASHTPLKVTFSKHLVLGRERPR